MPKFVEKLKTSFLSGDVSAAIMVSHNNTDICTAARKVLAAGVDPTEEIDVRRDGQPAFTWCLTVETWAGLTVSEDGDRGARFRPYRGAGAPHSGNLALQVSDCPEDETPISGPSVRGVG